jgi:hypothetical protein
MSSVDMVNEPPHYQGENGIECIDAIQAATAGLQGFEGYCIGNAIKYLWRWKAKGGRQDLEKARWYLDRVINDVRAAGADDRITARIAELREAEVEDRIQAAEEARQRLNTALLDALRVPAARPEMDAYDQVEAHHLAGGYDRG